MTLTRGIVTYAAIVTLCAEVVAAVVCCGVVAPMLVLRVSRDREVDSRPLVSALGIAFFALLGLVIVIWSVWAVRNLRDRLHAGSSARVGVIGAAALHVAASAVALLVPLVLAVTLPALALLLTATLVTRPRRPAGRRMATGRDAAPTVAG
ncbi:hypothetical protein [Embleya scabrispora]|jgi:hypothetical protein|uniref:hypothetical protein n=1 Tax=Embleya scabrispora TaxID=159449 RepID=UPI000371F64D|nr:hypothetical protein [Embleya scabrispora]MYS85270.1 hypothetical protein [Streptomyces sp. SID5474]